MASLSGFPFRLTPLMARTRSPMWMAPVLQGEQSRGDRDTRVHQTVPTGWQETCQAASAPTETETNRLLVTKKKRQSLVTNY